MEVSKIPFVTSWAYLINTSVVCIIIISKHTVIYLCIYIICTQREYSRIVCIVCIVKIGIL